MIKLLKVILCLVSAVAITAEPVKVAVALSDLVGQGGIDGSTASFISDRLRNELFNTNVFTVVERGQMAEILKEQGFQQSGACNSDACVVEVGQLLGVKNMLAGSIGKVGSTYSINVRLIDVATGKIIQTATTDCRCEIDDVLSRSTVDIARKLAKNFAVAQTIAPPAKPAEPQFGSLYIKTDPDGANVNIEGVGTGITPFINNKLTSGKYHFSITKGGFKDFSNKVKVEIGETTMVAITLQKLATPKINNLEPIAKKRKTFRIVMGGGSLVCLAAGLFYNSQAQKKIDMANSIQKAYDSRSANASVSNYSAEYKENITLAKKNLLFRNIVYGLSAIGAVSFSASFAF